jgi:hypothetical protein
VRARAAARPLPQPAGGPCAQRAGAAARCPVQAARPCCSCASAREAPAPRAPQPAPRDGARAPCALPRCRYEVLEQLPHRVELRKYAPGELPPRLQRRPAPPAGLRRGPGATPSAQRPAPGAQPPCTPRRRAAAHAGRWVATTLEGRGLTEAYKVGIMVGVARGCSGGGAQRRQRQRQRQQICRCRSTHPTNTLSLRRPRPAGSA